MLAGLQFASPGDVTDPINANDSEVICCISTVTYDLISYDYMQHDSRATRSKLYNENCAMT